MLYVIKSSLISDGFSLNLELKPSITYHIDSASKEFKIKKSQFSKNEITFDLELNPEYLDIIQNSWMLNHLDTDEHY